MIDYQKYLRGRVLIISGVGRSGTTILGKVLGSCKNTCYFFEPAIMKYIPSGMKLLHDNSLRHFFINSVFLPTLFEDYILPAIQGRNININKKDWSYYGNYQTNSDLCKRFKLNRRLQALEYIEQTEPYFIFKCNEAQYLYDIYNDIFEDVKILHINRNMIHVIGSMMKRGWFVDDYQPIDIVNDDGMPCYVDNNLTDKWKNWNPETRAAYVWKRLNKIGHDFYDITDDEDNEEDNIRFIHYKELRKYPHNTLNNIFEWCGLKPTELTKSHIQSIVDFVELDEDDYHKEIKSKINFGG